MKLSVGTALSLLSLLPLTQLPARAIHLALAPQTLRSDEATLVWDAPPASAASPAVTYQILRDGSPVATTIRTFFTAGDLLPDHDYTFAVRAANPTPSTPATASAPLTLHTPPRGPVVSVLDHGAVGDGKTLDTRALQSAIDACPPGGTVLLPPGVFLSGALYLKSHMTLELAKGAILQGSANPDDYTPLLRNRFEGWELDTFASLLNAGRLDHAGPANVTDLTLRGQGVISGGGKKLADAIRAKFPGDKLAGFRARPRLILLMNADHVAITGLTLKESPCWTLHYIYSSAITCRDLAISSNVLNGDGMDPDSSRDVFILGCSFDTKDDCIAIKSGKNPEGDVIARPSENIRILGCRFARGHGISIGSEMSGGVRGVLVEDCVAGPLLNGLQIKATPARGGFVEDVTVRDCDLQKITVLSSVNYNNDGAPATDQPFFRHFRFEHLDLTAGKPGGKKGIIDLNGFPAEGHELSDVTFDGLRLPASAQIHIDRARDVTFRNVVTADGPPPAFRVTRSENITR